MQPCLDHSVLRDRGAHDMGVRHGQPEGLDRFQKTIIAATWGHYPGIDNP